MSSVHQKRTDLWTLFPYLRHVEETAVTSPHPKDPLDDPIAHFVRAVDEFLATNLDFEPPPQASNEGGLEALKRNWEELKRAIRKIHASIAGAQPEFTERLRLIAARGVVVLDLTDDPYIVNPVNDLMRMASELRADIDKLETILGKATSILGVVVMVLEMAGIKARITPLQSQIAAARDDLIAYNLMRTPPPESA